MIACTYTRAERSDETAPDAACGVWCRRIAAISLHRGAAVHRAIQYPIAHNSSRTFELASPAFFAAS